MGLLSLLLVSVFSACERISDANAYALLGSSRDNAGAAAIADDEAAAMQAALRKDAQLAHGMPLKQFARHMKKRHSFYRHHNLLYQDDEVSIKIEQDKMRIETRKGKVKIEYTGDEAK